MNNKPHIIAITGGSGSGKTFLCDRIIEKFGKEKILKIEVDSYYKDLIHLRMEEREKNNFDHPNAFEFDLLYTHLNRIKNLTTALGDNNWRTVSNAVDMLKMLLPDTENDNNKKNDIEDIFSKIASKYIKYHNNLS